MTLLDDLREEAAEQEADRECDSAWTAELVRAAIAELERLEERVGLIRWLWRLLW